MSDIIMVGEYAPPEVWEPTAQYRLVACQQLAGQKLQQLWRERRTWEGRWHSVETVILTDLEYHQDSLPE